MNFKIPKVFTQGDGLVWTEWIEGYDPSINTLACFLRGQSALDLTGTPLLQASPLIGGTKGGCWIFEISSPQSATLGSGVYLCQFVIFAPARKSLGVERVEVCPNFENLTTLDTSDPDEVELKQLNEAIARLSSGVAEYYIGDRRVRYQELSQLYERQKYLRNRIAKKKNRPSIGGRNIGISFG